jgi:hypothetical protein
MRWACADDAVICTPLTAGSSAFRHTTVARERVEKVCKWVILKIQKKKGKPMTKKQKRPIEIPSTEEVARS